MDRHSLGLLLVSLIWGTTFVAVKVATEAASPVLFVGVRFALAALASLPWLLRRRSRSGERIPTRAPEPAVATVGTPDAAAPGATAGSSGGSAAAPRRGQALARGIPLGIVLLGAYATQTIGLTTTTPARSAFVTGLNVALVPFWGFLLTRRSPGWLPVAGLLLTLPGLWLLTAPDTGAWNRGDSWTLVCAVLYALYVVLVGRWGGGSDLGGLLATQLGVTAVLALAASPLVEAPRFDPRPELLAAVAWTALLATTGTTWLQLRLQPKVGPTRAAVIYATEPVFAAFFAWVLLGETLALRGWAGGGLILAGMLVSEIGMGRGVPERA